MAEQYGGQKESRDEREAKVKKLRLSVWDLFDTSKPWVLVPDGSLLGYFDFVPVHLRYGPWSPVAVVFLFVIVYSWLMMGIWWSLQEEPVVKYPKQSMGWWYYNLFGFVWMMYISVTVWRGPAGPNAWATYSMWTWTIIMLRHGLAVLEGLSSESVFISSLLRWTHFSSLNMATIVAFMWNFVIAPVMYFGLMKTPEAKRKFFQYFFKSFRLIQLHVFCILYAVLNSMSTPLQKFHFGDVYIALSICFVYMLLYLLVLDRIGVHIYPIFSPRTHWCIAIWSFVWFLHYAMWWMWNWILDR